MPALITHFRRAFIIPGQREGNKKAWGLQADTFAQKKKVSGELSDAAIPNAATVSFATRCSFTTPNIGIKVQIEIS